MSFCSELVNQVTRTCYDVYAATYGTRSLHVPVRVVTECKYTDRLTRIVSHGLYIVPPSVRRAVPV